MILGQWQTADDDATSPKTWAGRQEIHKIARASQDALIDIRNRDLEDLMNHSCVMRTPKEYQKNKVDQNKPVEPFYFDARWICSRFGYRFFLGCSGRRNYSLPRCGTA